MKRPVRGGHQVMSPWLAIAESVLTHFHGRPAIPNHSLSLAAIALVASLIGKRHLSFGLSEKK